MRNILYVVVFCLFILNSFAGVDGVIYRSISTGVVVKYQDSDQTYIFSSEEKTQTYNRRSYKKLLQDNLDVIPLQDRQQFNQVLNAHATSSILAAPNAEEALISNLQSIYEIDSILLGSQIKCKSELEEKENRLNFDEMKLNSNLLKFSLNKDGFFHMGELTGVKLKFDTSNDSPLHGALGTAGMTTWGKGIEGDDRGKTFGAELEVALEFDKGELALRKISDGYSKLGSVKGYSYMFGQQQISSQYYYDQDRKRYVEFLSIDGIELELMRELGSDDTYVRLLARKKTMDDQSGMSLSMQESWHKNIKENLGGKIVQYHYLDHLKKVNGNEAYIELGSSFELLKNNDIKISATPTIGAQVSSIGDSERFIKVGGELRLEIYDDEKNEKFPSWDMRLYTETKKYRDSREGYVTGVSISKRYHITKNGYVIFNVGLEKNKDRYSLDYGQEELMRNGTLDFDHKLGIRYDYKFN